MNGYLGVQEEWNGSNNENELMNDYLGIQEEWNGSNYEHE